MPCHPDRVRSAGLDAGYQFGDGQYPDGRVKVMGRWRRPSEVAAERLASAAFRITQAQLASERNWGTEYGEVRVPSDFTDEQSDDNPPRADDVWDQQPIPERGWNVIEGDSH